MVWYEPITCGKKRTLIEEENSPDGCLAKGHFANWFFTNAVNCLGCILVVVVMLNLAKNAIFMHANIYQNEPSRKIYA